MKAVKVSKKETEKTRKELIKLGLINNEYQLAYDGEFVLIPIKIMDDSLNHHEIVDREFNKIKNGSTKLKDHLKDNLSDNELENVKRAFDVIGDIAIIEIPENLESKENEIAQALLKLNKNIKVVAKKVGIYKGEFRTRDLEIISGEDRKETMHKENNVRLKLNAETCYFSPRLSTERKRIAQLVKPGEVVLVMFSGVGPYPVVLSKNTEAKEIYGVEINPDAALYAQENVRLNKCKNVKVFQGDVREVVPQLGMKFDRILMPLPKSAEDFLDVALGALKKGGIIHFYDFLFLDDIPQKAIEKIEEHIKIYKILKVVKCGQYSPKKFRICVDFSV